MFSEGCQIQIRAQPTVPRNEEEIAEVALSQSVVSGVGQSLCQARHPQTITNRRDLCRILDNNRHRLSQNSRCRRMGCVALGSRVAT